jgi:3D (Asp-Asp-Asp) domain-containing protein
MIRFFYCSCLLVFGMGFPVLAKSTGVSHPAPSPSSKAGNKSVLPPAVATAKVQTRKNTETVITQDITRGAILASPAEKQEAVSSKSTAVAAVMTHPKALASSVTHRKSSTLNGGNGVSPVRTAPESVATDTDSAHTLANARLARVTAYWAAEGDYYTERCMSATGVRLHDGHCAVDPNIIPYGSVVDISGVGKFLAVDTGSAVISRTAAREGGHTAAERHAIVVDLFFEDRSEGERFAAGAAKYVSISWWTPDAMGMAARAARSLFADENWTKIQSKQL